MLDLRKYFTPQMVAQRLKQMTPLKTTVVDTFFARKVNHPFDKVGRSDLTSVVAAIPYINRGAGSLAISRGTLSLDDFEPFEIAAHDFFTAADMNRLKNLDEQSIQARLAGVDDILRRTCRTTAEAISAKALTGTIEWPVRLENGATDTYSVTFGDTLDFTPGTLWDDSAIKLRQVFADLQSMETAIQNAGYGGTVKFWAGTSAYSQLLALAETYAENPKAKLRIEISSEGITIGGFLIQKMAETYVDPVTDSATAKVAAKKIMAFATDAVHTLFYCALDDLDGNLAPMPYFSKNVKSSDPSGVKIIGRSKPFPAPVVNAICWATVIS
jgi:hypothetical protein